MLGNEATPCLVVTGQLLGHGRFKDLVQHGRKVRGLVGCAGARTEEGTDMCDSCII